MNLKQYADISRRGCWAYGVFKDLKTGTMTEGDAVLSGYGVFGMLGLGSPISWRGYRNPKWGVAFGYWGRGGSWSRVSKKFLRRNF
jgi:hypothetical protein